MPAHLCKPEVLFFFLFIILLPISACDSRDDDLLRRTQFIMGTLVEITIHDAGKQKAENAAGRAFDEMHRLERLMSTHIDDSEISRLNKGAGDQLLTVSPEVLKVIERSLHWGNLSNGTLDISIGPAANLWRFNEENLSLPDTARLRQALTLVNFRDIEIQDSKVRLKQPGMALHLGAIAKGYAVDRAMDTLQSSGIQNAIINAGGDLKAIGTRQDRQFWRIGIQHPRNPEKMIAAFALPGKAVATSGDYQKYFMQNGTRYHHILNPRNGMPARGLISVTIIAESVMDADALATATFVLGLDKGMELIDSLTGIEGMMVSESGDFHFSKNFQSLPEFTLKGLEDDFSH